MRSYGSVRGAISNGRPYRVNLDSQARPSSSLSGPEACTQKRAT